MTMPGLPAPSQGGGLFQIVKEGLAFGVGSSIAHHAVGSLFNSFGGGGGSAAPPPAAAPPVSAEAPPPQADDEMSGFSDDDGGGWGDE